MLPEFPLEIWTRIASYIPDADLCKLCSLNRHFFDLAMNVKYKELKIQRFSNESVAKLYLARAPSLAKRIRYLDLELSAFYELSAVAHSKPSSSGHLRTAFGSFLDFVGLPRKVDLFALTSRPYHEVVDTLVAVGKHMDNIQHFRVGIFPRHISMHTLDYLRDFWSLISGHVSALSLEIPGEDIRLVSDIFPDLSRLKHLSLHWYYDPFSWSESIFMDLTSFLNRAAETLEHLTLSSHSSIAIRFLFNNLNHFSKLTRVDLDIPFDKATGLAVVQFLNRHGEDITSLCLKAHAHSEYVGAEVTALSSLHLPSLRNLDLWCRCLRSTQLQQFWNGTLDFPILDRLSMFHPFITQEDILLFCETFRQSVNNSQLRHLRLCIWTLNGPILDALAYSFPCLQTLDVRLRILYGDREPWDLAAFAAEMEHHQYPGWELHDLTIAELDWDLSIVKASYTAMEIVAGTIPSLQSFCGNGHMETPAVSVPSSFLTQPFTIL